MAGVAPGEGEGAQVRPPPSQGDCPPGRLPRDEEEEPPVAVVAPGEPAGGELRPPPPQGGRPRDQLQAEEEVESPVAVVQHHLVGGEVWGLQEPQNAQVCGGRRRGLAYGQTALLYRGVVPGPQGAPGFAAAEVMK